MDNKHEFILDLESKEGVFSLLKFHRYTDNLIKYLDENKMSRVFESGVVSNKGKAKWNEVIFKTAQSFYLHVRTVDVNGEDEYELTIYYKPQQLNELLLVTTKLLKPFKDAADNNGATEREN